MVMMTGQRSISFSSRVEPKITSGIEIARPRTSSVHGCPCAAAATAITLSRLITRSAIRIVLTAAIRLSLALDVLVALLGHQQLHADPEQQQRADQLQPGQRQQRDGEDGEHDPHHHRRAEPQNTAGLLLLGGSERAASAITTALSPDRTRLTPMILSRPIQNACV